MRDSALSLEGFKVLALNSMEEEEEEEDDDEDEDKDEDESLSLASEGLACPLEIILKSSCVLYILCSVFDPLLLNFVFGWFC